MGCWSTISIIVSKAAFPFDSEKSLFFCSFSYFNVDTNAFSILSVRQENFNKISSFTIFIKNSVTQWSVDTFTSIFSSSNPFENISLKLLIAVSSKELSLTAFKVHKTSITNIANFLLNALFWSLNHFNISINPFERFVA